MLLKLVKNWKHTWLKRHEPSVGCQIMVTLHNLSLFVCNIACNWIVLEKKSRPEDPNGLNLAEDGKYATRGDRAPNKHTMTACV